MSEEILHITNGISLTNYIKELNVKGNIITWHEMLCEGPTIEDILSSSFFDLREDFLNRYYNLELDKYELRQELSKLDNVENYSKIILWFEYDLFCHINLIAVINLLHQKRIELPLHLVTSGRVEGENGLKGLSELKPNQLLEHYKNKILLLNSDIDLAKAIWSVYCGKDHNLLKPHIIKQSSFPYLSNCLKAHLRRFPNSNNGLNSLEYNILKLIDSNEIKSEHHLLGYALNYQGYYGFNNIQMERIIKNLLIFMNVTKNGITLNRKGHEAMIGHHNFSSEINNNVPYGGIERLSYQYNRKENRLIKTTLHAN